MVAIQNHLIFISLCCYCLIHLTDSSKHDRVLKKDPGFLTELDLENLYDQWEENEEPLAEDELPPHKRPLKPGPAIDMPLDGIKNQEDIYKLAKKGKTLMTFVTVANNPARHETDELTARWEIGLTNAHIKCKRYIIADDRAIFVFEDGALAYEAKKYFLDQPELKDYSIENQVFHGKGHPVEYPNAKKSTNKSKEDERGEL